MWHRRIPPRNHDGVTVAIDLWQLADLMADTTADMREIGVHVERCADALGDDDGDYDDGLAAGAAGGGGDRRMTRAACVEALARERLFVDFLWMWVPQVMCNVVCNVM